MNGTLSKFIIFTAGAAVGSAVTFVLLREQYKKLADEEAALFRKELSNIRKSFFEEPVEEDVENEQNEADLREHNEIVTESGYTNYANIELKKEAKKVKEPYVIAPEDYGELDDYDIVSLTYYADGILANDMDEPIEDVELVVGRNSLNHFGEYEDDSVFVRDDENKIDYKILSDTRKYSDAVKRNPHLAEDE